MLRTFLIAVCCLSIGCVANSQTRSMKPKAFFPEGFGQTQSVRNHVSVSINGVVLPGVRKVSGMNALEDSLIQRETGRTGSNGLVNASTSKPGTIVITRDWTNSTELQQWHKNVKAGKLDRRSVSITVFNNADQPGRTVTLKNCWPTKYERPFAVQQKTGIAKEKIELTYESVQVSSN